MAAWAATCSPSCRTPTASSSRSTRRERAPLGADPEALPAPRLPDAGRRSRHDHGPRWIRGRQGPAHQGADRLAATFTATSRPPTASRSRRTSPGASPDGPNTLGSDPGFANVFLADGVPGTGDTLAQPALATTLRALADEGPDAFYGGELGARFVDGLHRSAHRSRVDDLASHAADLVPPLRGRYRDLDVSVTPPASQGPVLLEALAAVERELDPDPVGRDAGMLALVLAAAAADRDRHLADPAAMSIHVSALLDDGHLAALCDTIREGSTGHPVPRPGSRTSRRHDRPRRRGRRRLGGLPRPEPTAGSAPASEPPPASCRTIEAPASRRTGHPNVFAPGKRPAHTLMPVAVHRDGTSRPWRGRAGGHGQPQIDLMVLARAFDLGLAPADAVAAPCWLVGGMSPLGEDRWIHAEDSVPRDALAGFARAGSASSRAARSIARWGTPSWWSSTTVRWSRAATHGPTAAPLRPDASDHPAPGHRADWHRPGVLAH